MPTVPRISGPQVATAPLPGARLPVGAPAGAFDRGPMLPDLTPVSQAVREIVLEETRKAEQIAYTEASATLALRENALLHGERGVLTRRGRDAFTAPEETQAAWQKDVGEIAQGITSRRAREAFLRDAAVRSVSVDQTVQRHVAAERARYDEGVHRGLVDAETMAALAAPRDAERIAMATARITAATNDYAKRNGIPPELRQQAVGEAVSRVHLGVLERLLGEDDYQAASTYYAAHKDAVQADARGKVEQALEATARLGEAQRRADAIMALPDLTTGRAFDEARKITDAELRRAVEGELTTQLARRERAEAEAYSATLQQAAEYVEQGAQPPGALWARLQPQDRRALTSWRAQVAGGQRIETNFARYGKLLDLASDPATRQQFLDTDLLRYRHELADPELKQLQQVRASLLKGDGGVDEQLRGYRTTRDRVRTALVEADLNPSAKPSSDMGKRVAALEESIDRAIRDARARNGGKSLSIEDEQRVIDEQLIAVTIRRPGFDRERLAGEVPLTEQAAAYVPWPRIPETERQALQRQFRQRSGREATRGDVERAYAAFRIGNRTLLEAILAGEGR